MLCIPHTLGPIVPRLAFHFKRSQTNCIFLQERQRECLVAELVEARQEFQSWLLENAHLAMTTVPICLMKMGFAFSNQLSLMTAAHAAFILHGQLLSLPSWDLHRKGMIHYHESCVLTVWVQHLTQHAWNVWSKWGRISDYNLLLRKGRCMMCYHPEESKSRTARTLETFANGGSYYWHKLKRNTVLANRNVLLVTGRSTSKLFYNYLY